jgi:hypothetical protein
MTGSIQLHPTLGVNPRLEVCCRCGKDTGVVLLGRQDNKFTCEHCHTVSYGSSHCLKVREHKGTVAKIGEYEKIPGALCPECEAEKLEHARLVAEGGVYWSCADCGAGGVILPHAALAQEVRAKQNVRPPEPLGVRFNKTTCPRCGPEKVV